MGKPTFPPTGAAGISARPWTCGSAIGARLEFYCQDGGFQSSGDFSNFSRTLWPHPEKWRCHWKPRWIISVTRDPTILERGCPGCGDPWYLGAIWMGHIKSWKISASGQSSSDQGWCEAMVSQNGITPNYHGNTDAGGGRLHPAIGGSRDWCCAPFGGRAIRQQRTGRDSGAVWWLRTVARMRSPWDTLSQWRTMSFGRF